jgi:hypothetical protein
MVNRNFVRDYMISNNMPKTLIWTLANRLVLMIFASCLLNGVVVGADPHSSIDGRQAEAQLTTGQTIKLLNVTFTPQDGTCFSQHSCGELLTIHLEDGRATGLRFSSISSLSIKNPGRYIEVEYLCNGEMLKTTGTYDEEQDRWVGFSGETSFGEMDIKFNDLIKLKFVDIPKDTKNVIDETSMRRISTSDSFYKKSTIRLTGDKVLTMYAVLFNQYTTWSGKRPVPELGPGAYEVVYGSGNENRDDLIINIGGNKQYIYPSNLQKIDFHSAQAASITAIDGTSMKVVMDNPFAGISGVDDKGEFRYIPSKYIKSIEFSKEQLKK